MIKTILTIFACLFSTISSMDGNIIINTLSIRKEHIARVWKFNETEESESYGATLKSGNFLDIYLNKKDGSLTCKIIKKEIPTPRVIKESHIVLQADPSCFDLVKKIYKIQKPYKNKPRYKPQIISKPQTDPKPQKISEDKKNKESSCCIL